MLSAVSLLGVWALLPASLLTVLNSIARMAPMTTLERYYIAHTALVGVMALLPSVALVVYSLKYIHSHKDPARVAFRYFKAALVVFSIFCLLDTLTYGLTIAYSRILDVANVNLVYKTAQKFLIAQSYLNAVAQFFDMLTDALVVIMLLRVSCGIAMVYKGQSSLVDRVLQFASYVLGVVLVALAFATFGLRIRFAGLARPSRQTPYSIKTLQRVYAVFNHSRHVVFSFRVIVLAISVGILTRSIIVRLQTRPQQRLFWPSKMLLASSMTWSIRAAYHVGSLIATTNIHDFRDDPSSQNYYYVFDVIFSIWPQLASLAFIFLLGTKQVDGLWSSQMAPLNHKVDMGWSDGSDTASEGSLDLEGRHNEQAT